MDLWHVFHLLWAYVYVVVHLAFSCLYLFEALSKVEQLEVENETLNRQIDELKAALYMTCALEEAPKPRAAWSLNEPLSKETKRVNFDEAALFHSLFKGISHLFSIDFYRFR